ncbi:MerR family transcriptional regulator [Streptococcus iniae]
MSDSYSTGEVAKDLGITVRAVQYYDKRELVKPSDFSEGGRRQYTKEDLEKLRLVTFLRDMDFSLAAIKAILTEDHNEQILELLLVQQIEQMTAEISDKKMKRDRALMLLKVLTKRQPAKPWVFIRHVTGYENSEKMEESTKTNDFNHS